MVKILVYETFLFSLGQDGAVANGNASGTSAKTLSSHQTFNISNEVFEEEELSSRTVSEDKISTITEVGLFYFKKKYYIVDNFIF